MLEANRNGLFYLISNQWLDRQTRQTFSKSDDGSWIFSQYGWLLLQVYLYILPSSLSLTIILSSRNWTSSPLAILVLEDLDSLPHLAKKLEEVSAEMIEDKSKGDALSKMFSILQISWFIAQCITRAIQHLPITLLEMTALAFAGLSIITYCLWWNKPLNVKYHISLDMPGSGTLRWTPNTEYSASSVCHTQIT